MIETVYNIQTIQDVNSTARHLSNRDSFYYLIMTFSPAKILHLHPILYVKLDLSIDKRRR